jgi:hypothetical protein
MALWLQTLEKDWNSKSVVHNEPRAVPNEHQSFMLIRWTVEEEIALSE